MTPEELGRLVRKIWIDYCFETNQSLDHSTVPWEEMDEWSQEVDRRIGVAVAQQAAAQAREPLAFGCRTLMNKWTSLDRRAGECSGAYNSAKTDCAENLAALIMSLRAQGERRRPVETDIVVDKLEQRIRELEAQLAQARAELIQMRAERDAAEYLLAEGENAESPTDYRAPPP